MFAGGNRTSAPQYHVKDDKLNLRPYNQALNKYTQDLCMELGQEGQDNCLFETRTAFDCLLRNKVKKNGDVMDNYGACKYHIQEMKNHVSRSRYANRLLDDKLKGLEDMRQSFV